MGALNRYLETLGQLGNAVGMIQMSMGDQGFLDGDLLPLSGGEDAIQVATGVNHGSLAGLLAN